MAVKIINVPELAFHSLGYEERHFVLCWKYLGTICGFEVEDFFFFLNYWNIFAAWWFQRQLNIHSLEQPFTYKRLLKV